MSVHFLFTVCVLNLHSSFQAFSVSFPLCLALCQTLRRWNPRTHLSGVDHTQVRTRTFFRAAFSCLLVHLIVRSAVEGSLICLSLFVYWWERQSTEQEWRRRQAFSVVQISLHVIRLMVFGAQQVISTEEARENTGEEKVAWKIRSSLCFWWSLQPIYCFSGSSVCVCSRVQEAFSKKGIECLTW